MRSYINLLRYASSELEKPEENKNHFFICVLVAENGQFSVPMRGYFYRWCGVVISKAFKTKVTFPKTKDFQNFSLCKAENTVWFFQFVHCREEMKVISMPVTQLAAWPRTTHTAIHG
ncbi:hypothetical protein MtrunA17_Chr4g0076021 [Medicago truncatula]|uniref:Uncharacterized protein n=1 Tax=Medicago truncatula TaxID=3880 RepID=A0A396IJT1_MEDTR|nr:hypothetical protein MtrunA17_Chr4g0076021 [Medicago truncatula]